MVCFIKRSFSYRGKSNFCHNIERIFIDILLPKSWPILVEVLYWQPKKLTFIDYLNNFLKESNTCNIQE